MMVMRACWLIVCVVSINGCSVAVDRHVEASRSPTAMVPAGKLDFGWRLSGDREIAPLQVFSDAHRTWLHWQPNQTLPVIVANGVEGDQVLSYQRQPPYTVIEGHWPKLTFRAGSQQAQARRLLAPGNESVSSPRIDPAALTSVSASDPPRSPGSQIPRTPVFSVTPEDQHLRQALVRWSALSGWRFQPEHWSVDVDMPLNAQASFTDDFVTSVQALVAATELSDRPLQPCFYVNQVLRIVAASEPCDRTVAPGSSV